MAQQQQFILYIHPHCPTSRGLSTALRKQPRPDVYVQNVQLLEEKPEWLDGVPIVADTAMGLIYRGTDAVMFMDKLHTLPFPPTFPPPPPPTPPPSLSPSSPPPPHSSSSTSLPPFVKEDEAREEKDELDGFLKPIVDRPQKTAKEELKAFIAAREAQVSFKPIV